MLCMLFCTSLFAQQDTDLTNSANRPTFAEDLIVLGSAAIGLDSATGEVFGFDTVRLKENNLRIHFDDTSLSAGFPANDWRIEINDTNTGGANFFRISDVTAATIPFTIMAGAGNDALFINNGGDVGLGNANPSQKLHLTDGDTPSLRLEQNGTFGWTPQTWDVAGNEANFFIRDITHGNILPFRIIPGANYNSLVIGASGSIGMDIGSGGGDPVNNFASLELGSTTKGLLLNRLTTTNRIALADNAVAGMLVYDTDENTIYFWNGTEWVANGEGATSSDDQNLTSATLNNNTLTIAIENGNSVDVDLSPILAPLQASITNLETQNTAQQVQIDDLISRMEALEACACSTLTVPDTSLPPESNIRLNQNIPNPFNGETSIGYYIPFKHNQANLTVVSSLGQVIFNIPITTFGEGTINIRKDNLQAAIYYYSLYVDGKKIATKRLVVK